MMVAKADLIINPDLERWYAKRARSHTVEIGGASHSVYESPPKEVAAMIEDAANHSQKRGRQTGSERRTSAIAH